MAHELPPLPYDYSALEPHIDNQTMHLHHDGHHAANDGEMNDDDAAESYLAEPLNPGERPIS